MRLKLEKNSVNSVPRVLLVFLMIVQLCDFAPIGRYLLESDSTRPTKTKLGNSKWFQKFKALPSPWD